MVKKSIAFLTGSSSKEAADSRTRLPETVVAKNEGAYMEERFIVAADIGGTKTNLGLFRVTEAHSPALVATAGWPSRSVESPAEFFLRFRSSHPFPEETPVVIGVAGPVLDNESTPPNLPWRVSAAEIETSLGGNPVTLINDLVATACSVLVLPQETFVPLHTPAAAVPGNIAVIAAGTGLGEALLIRHGQDFIPCPTEGGHKDFAPRNELEWELSRYLAEQYGHVSVERVLSGQGIVDIHAFLRKKSGSILPAALAEKLGASTTDPAAVITTWALAAKDPVCVKALELFTELYGAEAGNLALQATATGGVFLGGGIAPKIVSLLSTGPFLAGFLAKGRFREYLEQIPVRVIMDERAALWGCAAYSLFPS